jgi:hypothetical protein
VYRMFPRDFSSIIFHAPRRLYIVTGMNNVVVWEQAMLIALRA